MRPARKADNVTAICKPIYYKMWEPHVSQPYGPPRPVTGLVTQYTAPTRTKVSNAHSTWVALCTFSLSIIRLECRNAGIPQHYCNKGNHRSLIFQGDSIVYTEVLDLSQHE
jgi:hypothetical protein